VTSTFGSPKARTMSLASRAGMTTAPSASPPTVSSSWIVRSRSVPVTTSRSALSSRRTPDSTGNVPVRPVAALPAAANASARTSRSQRNFTLSVLSLIHPGGWRSIV
jgi:hypothetical protein